MFSYIYPSVFYERGGGGVEDDDMGFGIRMCGVLRIMGVEDDPLLAIVAEHILGTIEVASLKNSEPAPPTYVPQKAFASVASSELNNSIISFSNFRHSVT